MISEIICKACGNIVPTLVRHHWYDTDDTDHYYLETTVKNEPYYFEVRGKLLFYHERLICLQCNRLLIQSELRYFKGGGIKPFKASDDSHILPIWKIQRAFVKYKKGLEKESP